MGRLSGTTCPTGEGLRPAGTRGVPYTPFTFHQSPARLWHQSAAQPHPASAAASSPASANRSAGAFARHRSSTASRSAGTSGRTLRGGGTGSRAALSSTCT